MIHSVGEAILLMKVFPYLDSTYAILLMPLVAIIPAIVNFHAKMASLYTQDGPDGQNKIVHVFISLVALVCYKIRFHIKK